MTTFQSDLLQNVSCDDSIDEQMSLRGLNHPSHPVLADLVLETESIMRALLARLDPQEPEREAR